MSRRAFLHPRRPICPLAAAGGTKTVCCKRQTCGRSNRFCSLSPARFVLAALSRHLGHWESWIKKSISLVNPAPAPNTSQVCSAGTICDCDLVGSCDQEIGSCPPCEKSCVLTYCQCSLWNPTLPPCNVPLFRIKWISNFRSRQTLRRI